MEKKLSCHHFEGVQLGGTEAGICVLWCGGGGLESRDLAAHIFLGTCGKTPRGQLVLGLLALKVDGTTCLGNLGATVSAKMG